ncbi:diguanylate phosphodiesterase, putative [Babesia ovata]|uniref:Diguanylate phosphodiesterase, putative n=1 Tax=Babesia ovata TaxID=189622 RepID=A0A2H6KI77_9APIC|nr:diguanylate phosphodiesterase, putative [Babesia ovata]GBE62679.1 diguanylate phosphodiesterase, putative [Babesia ovata]
MSAEKKEYAENWLGLCTPFTCLNRKERPTDEYQEKINAGMTVTKVSAESNDSLNRLASIFEGLFRLDRQVIQLKAREAFVKSCLTDGEQFNIKIIAKGIHNVDELTMQMVKEHNIDKESVVEILNGLKLPQRSKLTDAVKTITYHLINKLSSIQHDLDDSLREYDSFHNASIDEYEHMRRRFFDLTLKRKKNENGIDFSVSKSDFMFIVNSKNCKMVDIIFSLLDDDENGAIDWGAFELNSGRILSDAKGFV